MKRLLLSVIAAVPILPGCAADPLPPTTALVAATYNFDAENPGEAPLGWRVEATPAGSTPLARWAVQRVESAPSRPGALAVVDIPHDQDRVFNLCWTAEDRARNCRLTVRFRAVSGDVDQGGGPIWRVQDANNYYICRANPLEGNFRLYKVVNGVRTQLASASVDVPADVWHTIGVTHRGDNITCTLNGFTRIEATDDAISQAGGVGVWTKADAITQFDDFAVTEEQE